MACSFWIYQSNDLEDDDVLTDEEDGGSGLADESKLPLAAQRLPEGQSKSEPWRPTEPLPVRVIKREEDFADAEERPRKG